LLKEADFSKFSKYILNHKFSFTVFLMALQHFCKQKRIFEPG